MQALECADAQMIRSYVGRIYISSQYSQSTTKLVPPTFGNPRMVHLQMKTVFYLQCFEFEYKA